eukprot:jgi/Tetstr1/435642/TSEL_024542.t1
MASTSARVATSAEVEKLRHKDYKFLELDDVMPKPMFLLWMMDVRSVVRRVRGYDTIFFDDDAADTCTAEHHAELVRFLSNVVKSSLMLRMIQRAATAATSRAGYHAMRALRDRFVGTRMDDIRAALD